MKKKSTVDPEWWKHIFDDIYLITDARSICNERLTRFEADIFEHFLEAGKEDPILDLCGGQGRHSIEFARRGYTNITTLDYSAFLLRLGRDSSLSDGVKFIRADARCVPVRENAYRSAGIFGCSFGYFSDDNENSAVLSEVHRVLVPGGRVLIDIPDGDKVLKKLVGVTWHEADKDIFVLRKREPLSGGIQVREVVLSRSRGLVREIDYFEKLYSRESISRLLYSAGFDLVKFNCELEKVSPSTTATPCGDLGCMSSRMIVTAHKP